MTSLHIAATYGSESLTRCLLTTGHDPNVIEAKLNTPLFGAVKMGSYSIATLLLDHNARIDLANHTGLTPLHAAAVCDSMDFLERLLSHDGDINCQCADGNTPLLYAVMEMKLEATHLLLKRGADPNKFNKKGSSPLYFSVINENTPIMEILLKNGADPNAVTKLKWVDPASLSLSTSAAVKQNGNESPIDDKPILIPVGNECHDPDVKRTPVSLAVEMGFEDGLDLLLSACGNTIPDGPEQDGNSILHYAIPLKNEPILLKLIVRGADGLRYSTNNQGETPLHIAAQFGNLMAARILVQAGCDIDKRDHTSSTPLTEALFHRQYSVASLLLSHGADEAIADEFIYGQFDGRSAIIHMGPRDSSVDDVYQRLPRLSDLLRRLRRAQGHS